MTAIDLFAGCGGFSTGARMAGVDVLWAGNHWQSAVQVHSLNHPETIHVCQDLHQADWSAVPSHDILLASPCCQGHSKARGKASGNPQHDASRATAWAVVSATEYHRPSMVIVENVPEFVKWALYPSWRMAMETLGYAISPHIIDSADQGVPQNRRRLFLICTRSKAPLMLFLPTRTRVNARSIIDPNAKGWSPVNKIGRSERTLERIENGRKAHGDSFFVAYYGSEHGGRGLDRPLGTVTTHDRYALIQGERMRMLNVNEYKCAMGFPSDFQLPSQHKLAVHLLGNAVCPPVVRDILQTIQMSA